MYATRPKKDSWLDFPGRGIFEKGKYRSDGLNPALAIILQKSNGLQNETTGNIVISENISKDAAQRRRVLEPISRWNESIL